MLLERETMAVQARMRNPTRRTRRMVGRRYSFGAEYFVFWVSEKVMISEERGLF
jgi:hypothetical protein